MAIIELVNTPGLTGYDRNDEMVKQELMGIESIDLLLICCAITDDEGRYNPFKMNLLIAMIDELFSKDDMEKKAVLVLTKCNKFYGGKESFEAAVAEWTARHRIFCQEHGYTSMISVKFQFSLLEEPFSMRRMSYKSSLTSLAQSSGWPIFGTASPKKATKG